MYTFDSIIIFIILWIHTVLYPKINAISWVGQPIQEWNASLSMLPLALMISLVRGGGISLDLISFNQYSKASLTSLYGDAYIPFLFWFRLPPSFTHLSAGFFHVKIVLAEILYSATNSLIFTFLYKCFYRISALTSIVRFWHFLFWDILAFENRKFLQSIYNHEWSH